MLSKDMIAKIALGLDESLATGVAKSILFVFKDDIGNLQNLAKMAKSVLCISDDRLVEIAVSNKMDDEESGHILSCARCAKIGHYISNMNVGSTIRRIA